MKRALFVVGHSRAGLVAEFRRKGVRAILRHRILSRCERRAGGRSKAGRPRVRSSLHHEYGHARIAGYGDAGVWNNFVARRFDCRDRVRCELERDRQCSDQSGAGGRALLDPPEPPLSPEAERGRALFFDAVRGFGRCSTCHEVNGIGISVTTPIAKIPADAAALRALATPDVRTATVDGEAMPALIVSQGKTRALFYDLTSAPPVLRTVDPGALKVAEGSAWRHASVIGAYNDAELAIDTRVLAGSVKLK